MVKSTPEIAQKKHTTKSFSSALSRFYDCKLETGYGFNKTNTLSILLVGIYENIYKKNCSKRQKKTNRYLATKGKTGNYMRPP
jgi:hypothetical protein